MSHAEFPTVGVPAAPTPVTAEQLKDAIARGVRDARIVAGDSVMPSEPTPDEGYVQDFGLETALYVPPAAPTPDPCDCLSGGMRLHRKDCPAAPEPSAEPYGTPAHQGFSCADTELGRAAWMHRAERAEAQLASVRARIDATPRFVGWVELLALFHDLEALLTDPSPVAGGGK